MDLFPGSQPAVAEVSLARHSGGRKPKAFPRSDARNAPETQRNSENQETGVNDAGAHKETEPVCTGAKRGPTLCRRIARGGDDGLECAAMGSQTTALSRATTEYPTLPKYFLHAVDRYANARAQMYRVASGLQAGGAWSAISAGEMLRRVAGVSRA